MAAEQRKQLMLVSEWIPDPEGTGSEQRVYSFLCAYARHFDVHLWFSNRPFSPDVLRAARLAGICASATYFHPELLRQNADGMKDVFVDALQRADHVHMFKLPFAVQHASIFWDMDELPPGLRGNDTVPGDGPARDHVNFGKTCTLRFASSALEQHAALGTVHVVPNSYYRMKRVSNAATPPQRLLFTGSFAYEPNVQAAEFLVDRIMPHLPHSVSVQLAGRKPLTRDTRSRMQRVAATPRITLAQDVPSCSPFYDDAGVAIVPLLAGSGTRLKILEAFAHGCPVVSTSKGCEGLQVQDGQQLLIRDAPEDFASACLQLLSDEGLRTSLARKAAAFLQAHHTPAAVEQALDAALHSVKAI